MVFLHLSTSASLIIGLGKFLKLTQTGRMFIEVVYYCCRSPVTVLISAPRLTAFKQNIQLWLHRITLMEQPLWTVCCRRWTKLVAITASAASPQERRRTKKSVSLTGFRRQLETFVFNPVYQIQNSQNQCCAGHYATSVLSHYVLKWNLNVFHIISSIHH